MHHSQQTTTDANDLAVRKQVAWRYHGWRRNPDPCGLSRGTLQQRRVGRVQRKRRSALLNEPGILDDMVDVRVGVEHPREPQSAGLHVVPDAPAVERWVH